MKNSLINKRLYFPGFLLLIAVPALFLIGTRELKGQKISRDLNVEIYVNQVGYVPDAGKVFVVKGVNAQRFQVVDLVSNRVSFTGNTYPVKCDFGDYSIGDFSQLVSEGHYYVKCDTLRSFPFRVSKAVYLTPMSRIVTYFSKQRCGSSTTGYMSPCHLDDGLRLDNGQHRDVSGGWHDATDLRKWVSATIYAMIGLSKTYELKDVKDPSLIPILEELKWGNQYFLKMQEPQGYVMNFVGGDINHPLAEGKWITDNRWTDNVVGKGGGEIKLITPTAGKSNWKMLIYGNDDDRIIQTDPVDMVAQFNFIASEAIMARITKDDPAYSQKCIDAATKCFEWCTKERKETDAGIISASIQAALEMFKTTNRDVYKNYAIGQASSLKKLQAKKSPGSISGFFFTSEKNNEPFKDIWHGCLGLISICDMIRMFPTHPDVQGWKDMVSDYSRNYLTQVSQKNSFGIVPYGLFRDKDPGGNRRVGIYWYRYFMQPELGWWVGVNANIASAGVGLMKASAILDDPKLKTIAQKQLDWIIGVNPFGSSTLIGFGHNHPVHYYGASAAFNPPTPIIPGAVMNGIGGDKNDQPYIGNGDYNISEYWTPMVAYTLWLMAEITEQD